MFTVDEYLASIKTNLAQHTDVLVKNLKTIAEANFAQDVELLDFSAFIEPSRHDLSIMFFSMDREANEVFEEEGTPGFAGSKSVLDEIVYMDVPDDRSEAFDVFYEEQEETLFEEEQRMIGEWFRSCFEQAGGATIELPCYFGVHDEGQTLDLKRNVWMDEEEKWD
ncbi:hypothetical protein [Exiguobacterium artemiae]|uniref:hypothetical protein n=1 Tax=Exiguobacterium artemiae TaxID=340145 RepID=UPI0029648E51|nr:hypothetical protein [Exiguobacterium sibiricum]MDW2885257.1 hypothetical protein [Exiguobacterium sibiricum]